MLHGQFAPEYLVRPPGTPWSNISGTHCHIAPERLVNFSGIPTLINAGQKKELKQAAQVSTGFKKDEVINYSGNTYKVIDTKPKSIKVEDASGLKISVKDSDGLYKSLLEAKNNPREPDLGASEEQSQQQGEQKKAKIGR